METVPIKYKSLPLDQMVRSKTDQMMKQLGLAEEGRLCLPVTFSASLLELGSPENLNCLSQAPNHAV